MQMQIKSTNKRFRLLTYVKMCAGVGSPQILIQIQSSVCYQQNKIMSRSTHFELITKDLVAVLAEIPTARGLQYIVIASAYFAGDTTSAPPEELKKPASYCSARRIQMLLGCDANYNQQKKVNITNQEQFKALIELMEENPSIATNFRRGVSQTEDKKKEWKSIEMKLNSLGPPVRTEKEWQKVWFDAKFKVKQKLLYNKKQMEVTGGGPFRQKYLNDSDKAIAALLQLNQVVDPEGSVFGGCEQQISTSSVYPLPSCIPSTSTEQLPVNVSETDENESIRIAETETTSERNRAQEEPPHNTKSSLNEMLELQTNAQESLYLEVKRSLSKIEEHVKESARYERKRFHLKQEKFEKYKLKLKRQEEQQKKENEIRIKDLELKKRKLDLKERKLQLFQQGSAED